MIHDPGRGHSKTGGGIELTGGRGVMSGRAATPAGWRGVWWAGSGGVAALDHRLMAGIPAGCTGLGALMRRHLEIFVDFTVQTGHAHPHLNDAINNYSGLLMEIGETEAVVREKIGKIMETLFKG